MGSSKSKNLSKNSCGVIYLSFDKNVYTPGSTVSGRVFLYLQQKFGFSNMTLKVKGFEKIIVTMQNKRKQQKKTNIIYSKEMTLFTSQGGALNAGQYIFPFKFVLKEKMPPSFNFSERTAQCTQMAMVQYQLKVEAHSNSERNSNLSFQQAFMVNDKQTSNIFSDFKELTQPIKTCCCCNNGNTNFKLILDKNSYIFNEVIKATIYVDNGECLKGLKNMWLRLIQEFKSKNPKFVTQKIMSKIKLSSVKPREEFVEQNAMNVTLHISRDQVNQPTLTEYTTIISNVYYLDLVGEIDGITCQSCHNCCGKQPSLKMPVQISNIPTETINPQQTVQPGQELTYLRQCYETEDPGRLNLPNTWNPQVMTTYNIILQSNTSSINSNFGQGLSPDQNDQNGNSFGLGTGNNQNNQNGNPFRPGPGNNQNYQNYPNNQNPQNNYGLGLSKNYDYPDDTYDEKDNVMNLNNDEMNMQIFNQQYGQNNQMNMPLLKNQH